MSLKFKLVKFRNLSKDRDSKPYKVFASPVYTDEIGFKELLAEISEAGIPSNQVKGVFDRMNHLICKYLSLGYIVRFGELGSFRFSVGSTGSDNEEDFSVEQIKKPRIVFTPGATLKKLREEVTFELDETNKEDAGS